MQKKWKDRFKRALEALGDDPKTSVQPTPLNRSSSQMPRALPSRQQNLNGSLPTLQEMGENLSSSLNLFGTTFESYVQSSESHAGRDRDVVLVVHMQMHGTEDQMIQSGRTLLRIMEVKGYNFSSATINDHPIEAAKL